MFQKQPFQPAAVLLTAWKAVLPKLSRWIETVLVRMHQGDPLAFNVTF